MELKTLLVRLSAAIFVLFGIAFTLAPALMSELSTGAVPATASAMIDMRATYGGLSLGVAALLFALASTSEGANIGLLAVGLIMLGMATTRLAGILIDGEANTLMYIYLALEIMAAAIAFLVRDKDQQNNPVVP